jgi:hypothetical protein
MHTARIHSYVQPEAFGYFGVAGIPEHQDAPADQHGDVFHLNLKLVQDGLDAGIAFDINISVRMTVAREERT